MVHIKKSLKIEKNLNLTPLFKSTPSWITDNIVLAHVILSQIDFLKHWDSSKVFLSNQRFIAAQSVVWESASSKTISTTAYYAQWPPGVEWKTMSSLGKESGGACGATGRMQIWKIVLPTCFSWENLSLDAYQTSFYCLRTMESSSTSSHFACPSQQNRGCQIIKRRIQ